MKTEKKFFLDRSEIFSELFPKIKDTKGVRIVVNIPKNWKGGDSVHRFHELRDFVFGINKELIIESVDDHILELASLAGVVAINPIFHTSERAVSDIIPKTNRAKQTSFTQTIQQTKDSGGKRQITESLEKPHVHAEENVAVKRKKRFFHRHSAIAGKGTTKRVLITLGAIGCIAVVAFFLGTKILPKATITVTLEKTIVSIFEEVEIRSDATEVNILNDGRIVVPGELFVSNKNVEIPVTATEISVVEEKARGMLRVYNAFGTQAQTLVATTRFESHEGKIFRLNERTTIPGARTEEGKLLPAFIDVAVTADQAGPEYNVGPSPNWKIPGFKGTPRYEGFYAEAVTALSGGFIGEKRVPNESDIEKAKKEVARVLNDVLESELLVLEQKRFDTVSGATEFKLVRTDVQERTQQEGQFGVFGEATMRRLVFDRAMLFDAVVAKATRNLSDTLVRKDISLNYGTSTVNLGEGTLSFSISGSVLLGAPVDKDTLQNSWIGMNEATLRGNALGVGGIEKIEVSLWPMWVTRVPENSNRVTVILQ